MTNTTFNLIDDGWIPVMGEPGLQSLRDIFSRQDLRRLGGNPVEKIVMLRLLLAIAHAAVELPDREAWLALTPERLSAAALAYLKQWHDRFFLYGDNPFLQFPALSKGESKPNFATSVEISSGNNLVLTSWNVPLPENQYNDAFKARMLLRQSCFRSARGGVIKHPEKRKYAGNPGTLLGQCGYLHSYMVGENLLQTIHYNMLCAYEIAELKVFSGGVGRPFWEQMLRHEDDSRAREMLVTYQGQLFPLDKFLLLKDGGIVMTDGIAYPNHKSGLMDPALTFRMDDKEVRALWCSTEKKPWRELVALLGFLDVQQGRKMPRLLSCGLAKLACSDAETMTFWTGGMRVTPHAGEQYLSGTDDYVESEFHISIPGSAGTRFLTFREMVETLDVYARALYGAINGYFKELQSNLGADIAPGAVQKFWELLEQRSQIILDLAFAEHGDRNAAIADEHKLWQRTALQIYHETCPNVTARQLTAWIKAMPKFTSGKNKKEKKDAK